MSYLMLVLLGLSFGVLTANANIPRIRVLPLVATFVVIGSGALVLSSVPVPGLDPANLYVLGPAMLAGTLIAAPVLWKEHPLLAGLGFFERLRISFSQARMLRDTYDKPVPQDSEPSGIPG